MTGVLALARDAADELSLARPADITDTDDNTSQKLFRHMTRTCRQLAAEYDWTRLRREKLITATATEEQTNAIPADFLRFVPETLWNRNARTRLCGPINPDDWQARKAVLSASPYSTFIMRGTSFLMTPAPTAGHIIAYEYITKNIASAAGDTEVAAFVSDDDAPFFDDELVILGTVWRYRKAEGLDYSEEFREYQMRRANMIKMDGGTRRLDMGGDKIDRPVNTTYTEIEDIFTL